jgi:hypothetical protein
MDAGFKKLIQCQSHCFLPSCASFAFVVVYSGWLGTKCLDCFATSPAEFKRNRGSALRLSIPSINFFAMNSGQSFDLLLRSEGNVHLGRCRGRRACSQTE